MRICSTFGTFCREVVVRVGGCVAGKWRRHEATETLSSCVVTHPWLFTLYVSLRLRFLLFHRHIFVRGVSGLGGMVSFNQRYIFVSGIRSCSQSLPSYLKASRYFPQTFL